MQLEAMRAYAERKGWRIASTIEEVGSGAKTRPRREELLRAARRREIDVIVVWRLDRWGRSLVDLIATLEELDRFKDRLRLVERGARSDDTQRAGVRRHAGGLRRVRVRHSARPGESRHCSSPQGRSTSRQAGDNRRKSPGNTKTRARRGHRRICSITYAKELIAGFRPPAKNPSKGGVRKALFSFAS